MKKVELTSEIKYKMQMYRQGFECLPDEYIQFHKDLAEKEIDRLKELGFKEVLDTKKFKGDGWLVDRMKIVYIDMVYNNKVYNLHWHDGNQEFFVQSLKSGGSSPLSLHSDFHKKDKFFSC